MAKSGRGMMPRQTALQRRGFRSPTPPRPSPAPRSSSSTHAGRPPFFTPPPMPPMPPRTTEPPAPEAEADTDTDAASARRQELEHGGPRGDRRRG